MGVDVGLRGVWSLINLKKDGSRGSEGRSMDGEMNWWLKGMEG